MPFVVSCIHMSLKRNDYFHKNNKDIFIKTMSKVVERLTSQEIFRI